MKKISKFIGIILPLIILIILCNSCGIDNKTKDSDIGIKKSAEPKIKLRFINSWGGVDSKADTLKQVFNAFMEDNPNIEVVNESMFGDDFLPKLKTDFASGNDPDVFGLWPGSDIRALVKSGKVADLDDELSKDKTWKDSFGKSAWSYTTFDNKIYGLPLEIIYEGLFVNKDLFEKYYVKVPKTFNDLKQAVIKFKSNGIIPIAYNSYAEGTYLYQNIVAMLGGKEEVEHPFNHGKVSKCYLDAVAYLKELYNLGAFSSDAFTLNSNERNNLFKNKKAAMIIQGSWFNGDLKDQDDTVDIVPFPYIDEKRPSALIYGFGCGAFYMSNVAENDVNKRAGCIKLLKALTSKNTAFLFASQTDMFSNVDISSFDVQYSKLAIKGQELVRNARGLVGPPDSFVDRTVWEELIVKNFPYVLEGRKTAESFWAEAEKMSEDSN
jgi:raffinose/stachyose/melibiose transport system substrate-binding protein